MDGLIALFVIVMFFVKIFGKNKKKSGAAPGKTGFANTMKQLQTLFWSLCLPALLSPVK